MNGKQIAIIWTMGIAVCLVALFTFTGCSRQGNAERRGSAEQITVFQQAVAFESQTPSIPDRQAAYMRVVAMDPTSEYGKAAAARVEQLSKELQSIMGIAGQR